jgi:hypothetical protein
MQFKLLVPHTHPATQQLLDSGTIVGDDTDIPWTDARGNPAQPSLAMVGMDDESQAHIDRHYDEEVRNDPLLPKNQEENNPEKATENLTINRANPNVSPRSFPGQSPAQTPNEIVADPLRGAPKGAEPSPRARAPQGGQTQSRNPLDLGQSTEGK